jgi:hypothetical protein
MDFRTDT